MKKRVLSAVMIPIMGAALISPTVSASADISIYVRPNGSDIIGNGSFYRPYKTVEKATEKVKELVKSGTTKDIDVIFREGEYTLSKTISYNYFSKAGYDGKITYKAYQDENVAFLGAEKSDKWELYKDGIYRIACENKVNSVFENGQNAIKARYPNRGEKRSDGYLTAAKDGTDTILYFNGGDFPAAANGEDLQCYLFPGQNYALDNPRVTANYAENSLTLEGPTTNHSVVKKGSRYYMQNALEFLDEPGEMYYNSSEKYLYYMPYNEKEINNVYIPNLKTAVSIAGNYAKRISDFEFSGIEFKYFDAGVTDAGYVISVNCADRVNINNCSFTDSAAGGAFYRTSNNNEFMGNRIENIGGDGVRIFGKKLTDGNNTISDNYINNIGYYDADVSGIAVSTSSANNITHNRISGTPRASITFGSGTCQVWSMLKEETVIDGVTVTRDNIKPYLYTNDNLIAYNDCSNAMLETDDGGVIYCWGTGYDNKIMNNYIHDSNQEFSFGWIIYLDDDCSKTTVSGNLVKNCGMTNSDGIMDIIIVKGQDNVVENNLFVNCDYRNAMARVDSQSGAGPVGNAVFKKNIFYNCGATLFSFYSYTIGDTSENNRLKECNNNIYYDKNAADYGIKVRNSNNEYITAANKNEWQNTYGKDADSYFGFPGFYDIYSGDYRANEKKIKYGIESIDFVNAGLSKNYKYITGGTVSSVNVKAENSNEPVIHLTAGQSVNLEIAARDEYGIPSEGAKIEIISSDSSVCEVSGSTITAKGAGNATITALAKHGLKAVTAELYVSVD